MAQLHRRGFIAIGLVVFEHILPMAKFFGERRIDFAVAAIISIIPQAIMAMAVIQPARMIQNGIEANPMQGNAIVNGGACFAADISQPTCPRRIFRSGFRDEQRAMITLLDLGEHVPERAIERMPAADWGKPSDSAKAFQIIEPLIMRVKIDADNIEVLFLTA